MTSDSARRTPVEGTVGFQIRPHNCFACGELNVHGLRLTLHVEGERCWVELTLEQRFEGWEGIAHGGILCTILDEVMAWSLLPHDTWGVTAKLAVSFRRPVPVGSWIRAEGWVTEARRRTFRTEGRILDSDGREVASAEGLYVSAPEDRKAALKERYGFRIVSATPEVVDADHGDDRDSRDGDGPMTSGNRPAATPSLRRLARLSR